MSKKCCWVCGRILNRQSVNFNACGGFCSDELQSWNRMAHAQKSRAVLPCRACGAAFVSKRVDGVVCGNCRKNNQRAAYPKSYPKARAKQYGLTIEMMQDLLRAGCYVSGCGSKADLHIDHDHECCPGRRSCGRCVRGALCRKHNLVLGFIEKNWPFVLWATRNPMLAGKVRREA